MINALRIMRELLEQMTQRIKRDQSLPQPEQALAITIELNATRSALVALDNALHARHNERHPIERIPIDMTPTQTLDVPGDLVRMPALSFTEAPPDTR